MVIVGRSGHPWMKDHPKLPCCGDSMFWLAGKLVRLWSLVATRSLSKEHWVALPDVDSISPIPYPVHKSGVINLQVPDEKWWLLEQCRPLKDLNQRGCRLLPRRSHTQFHSWLAPYQTARYEVWELLTGLTFEHLTMKITGYFSPGKTESLGQGAGKGDLRRMRL
jgi:hypothetical protein